MHAEDIFTKQVIYLHQDTQTLGYLTKHVKKLSKVPTIKHDYIKGQQETVFVKVGKKKKILFGSFLHSYSPWRCNPISSTLCIYTTNLHWLRGFVMNFRNEGM